MVHRENISYTFRNKRTTNENNINNNSSIYFAKLRG